MAGCASVSDSAASAFHGSSAASADARNIYNIEVTNFDYDADELRIYCENDNHAILTMRGVLLGERRVKRVRGGYCATLRFASFGAGPRPLFVSPPISVNVGDTLRVNLAEHPRQTSWSVWPSPAA